MTSGSCRLPTGPSWQIVAHCKPGEQLGNGATAANVEKLLVLACLFGGPELRSEPLSGQTREQPQENGKRKEPVGEKKTDNGQLSCNTEYFRSRRNTKTQSTINITTSTCVAVNKSVEDGYFHLGNLGRRVGGLCILCGRTSKNLGNSKIQGVVVWNVVRACSWESGHHTKSIPSIWVDPCFTAHA